MCEQNAQTLKNTLKVIEKKFGGFLKQVSWINMGGGHLITADDYDRSLLAETLRTFAGKYDIEVILEPGAAVVWQTGYLITTVLDVVHANGISTAILDTSFAAHMPDCLEMPYNPEVYGASTPPEPGKPVYRLGGLTCLAGDFVGYYSFDKPLETGDRVVFDDMMHYTMVKTHTFNGVNLPSIGILKEDGSFERIRSFGYEDYRVRLS
jgi:carboxynorspermidine decarboxylase